MATMTKSTILPGMTVKCILSRGTADKLTVDEHYTVVAVLAPGSKYKTGRGETKTVTEAAVIVEGDDGLVASAFKPERFSDDTQY